MDSIGLAYLAEWGISEDTIKRFEENEISLELMKCMKAEELKELVPNIRERILFRSALEQLCKLINDTSSEAATASDIDTDDALSALSSPARASSASSSCNEDENTRSRENPRAE